MADARALDALRSLGQTALRVGRDTTSARPWPTCTPWSTQRRCRRTSATASSPSSRRRPGRPRSRSRSRTSSASSRTPGAPSRPPSSTAWRRSPPPSPRARRCTAASWTAAGFAVKVLRPGIVEVIRSDLGLAERAAAPAPGGLPGASTRGARRRGPRAHPRRARPRARGFDAAQLPPRAAPPGAAVHGALTHERVSVSDWVEGRPVLEAERSAVALSADRLPRRWRAVRHRARRPPPRQRAADGHDGRVAFIDFGAVRRVDRARADAAVGALDALTGGDAAGRGARRRAPGRLPAEAGHGGGRPRSSTACSPARPPCAAARGAWRAPGRPVRSGSPRSGCGPPSRPEDRGRCGCSAACSPSSPAWESARTGPRSYGRRRGTAGTPT